MTDDMGVDGDDHGHVGAVPGTVPAAPADWVPLAEPFTAPNGLVVEAVSTQAALKAIGDEFGNALENAGFRAMIASKVASGREHVYRTLKDGVMVSCGELKVSHGRLRVEFDRARRNAHGTDESKAAALAFADAVSNGAVECAYEIGEHGFTLRAPVASPGP